jgi:hypothetical protein
MNEIARSLIEDNAEELKTEATCMSVVVDQDLAVSAAQQGFVLLQNNASHLPLDLATTQSAGGIALIGPNAAETGSLTQLGNYHGLPANLIDIHTGLSTLLGGNASVSYAQGCTMSGTVDPESIEAAVALVSEGKKLGAVVLVLGLDGSQEAEGQDRHSLSLPGAQLQLLKAVSAAAKARASPVGVVVVIMSGGKLSQQQQQQQLSTSQIDFRARIWLDNSTTKPFLNETRLRSQYSI